MSQSTELDNLLSSLKAGEKPVTQDGMIVRASKGLQEITVGLLKKAIDKSPAHPLAVVYTNAVIGLTDNHTVNVDVTDLQGLLENREVIEQRGTTTEGRTVLSKKLGDSLNKPTPASPSVKTAKPADPTPKE